MHPERRRSAFLLVAAVLLASASTAHARPLTLSEIAEAMGMTRSNVAYKLARFGELARGVLSEGEDEPA